MKPELGIVIPAFNEASRLPQTLANILETVGGAEGVRVSRDAPGPRHRPASLEIVVVDDGSTDGTAAVVEALDDPRVSCVRLPRNRGKGAAVRAGLQATTATWVLICDADSSTPIAELERLTDTARATGAAVVAASRADADSQIGARQPRRREVLGQAYNRLLRALGLTSLRDTQCGFKLIRGDLARSLAPQLRTAGFAYDVELLWRAERAGARVVSVGTRWNHDADTRVRTLPHGSRMVLDALQIRWPFLARNHFGIAAAGILAVTLALHLWAVHTHSLTGDGAYHLVAGHQALRYGTNTVNLEHPPLAKLAMALPTLAWEPLAPPIEIGTAVETAIGLADRPALMWRATLAARYVVLLIFVVPLLFACVALGTDWGGRRAGLLLAAMVLFSFPVVGTLTILQTDAAVMLGFVLTVRAALGFLAAPTSARAAILGAALGFAMVVKFSGALLGPTVAAALLIGLWRRRASAASIGLLDNPAARARPQWLDFVVLPAIALVATAFVLHSAYALANLAYDQELGRAAIRSYIDGEGLVTGSSLGPLGPSLLALEPYHHGLSQWLTGFFAVRAQNQIGVYPSYAFGTVTSAGRWWYHPVVFLVTTPLAIFLAAAVAAVGWRRQSVLAGPVAANDVAQRRRPRTPGLAGLLLVASVVIIYAATAMLSNYNLGYRHLLPLVPLLYLPVAVGLARRPIASLVLVAALIVECFAVGPVWASSTNTWWLGATNPTRHSLGSAEFGQSLVLLDRAARAIGPETLAVIDPVLRAETLAAYVPTGRLVEPDDALSPGWYAVGLSIEQFLPALLDDHGERIAAERPELLFGDALRAEAERWLPLWQQLLRRGEDHGYVAGTYHLYRIAPAAGPPPNVLVITLDTVRADHLGSYGGTAAATPTLDALAADGILFENATSPLPETRPAHYSLFTSRYPDEHGVVANSAPRPSVPPLTLARVLGEAGFDTAGFAGCALFHGALGAELGFAHLDAPEQPQRSAQAVVEQFLAWQPDPDRPFFAWLHLFDAHMPYAPPPPFDRPEEPAAAAWPEFAWPHLLEVAEGADGALSAAALERARSLYAGEIEYIDHWLGRLFQELSRRGQLEQTVVVVTADHGECFSEGVYFEHSSCLGEGALRIPLLLHHPGLANPGQRVAYRAELLDVAPTILGLVGLPVPPEFGGRNLLDPAASDPAGSRAFFQFPAYTPLEVAQRTDRNQRLRSVAGLATRPIEADLGAIGAYLGPWKYTVRGDLGTLAKVGAAPDDSRAAARLQIRELLLEWAAVRGGDAPADNRIDPVLRARLRALGYLTDVAQRP
jgi:arylsulfatase A-like enzyme/glycosyltransferase involved in cell wall biosynthesis